MCRRRILDFEIEARFATSYAVSSGGWILNRADDIMQIVLSNIALLGN
jgi:hypothetical protein